MAAFTALAIASLAATGISAYQQHRAGRREQRAAEEAARGTERAGARQQEARESEAQLADYNAQVAALQSRDAIERGAEEESRFRTQIRGAVGAQRAGIAAGNIDVAFGSAVDVQADAAFLGELDALTVRTNAAREAWGYNVQAEDYRQRAAITRREGAYLAEEGREVGAQYRRQGREARSAANFAAAGTLLGGASSLLQARYGFGRT